METMFANALSGTLLALLFIWGVMAFINQFRGTECK